MKKLWLKERLLWTLAAVVGFTGLMVGVNQNVNAATDSNYLRDVYLIMRHDDEIDSVNDRIVNLALKKRETISMVTGYFNGAGGTKTYCGSKCADLGCLDVVDDTPFMGDFYGGNTLKIDTGNKKPSKVPKGVYFARKRHCRVGKIIKNLIPQTDSNQTNTCYLYSVAANATWTFRKYLADVDGVDDGED